MKKLLHVLVVAVLFVVTAWNMTASAAEQTVNEVEKTTVVEFDFVENFAPIEVYALEGAECFAYADTGRYQKDFALNQQLSCIQKTTNGFYCVVTEKSETCYVLQDAVSLVPGVKQKAVKSAKNNCVEEKSILFIYTSFDTNIGQVEITDVASGKQIILKGMACIDYQNTSFLTEASRVITVSKKYLDGSALNQTFELRQGNKVVGIYDDGSNSKSWLEIDGECIFE